MCVCVCYVTTIVTGISDLSCEQAAGVGEVGVHIMYMYRLSCFVTAVGGSLALKALWVSLYHSNRRPFISIEFVCRDLSEVRNRKKCFTNYLLMSETN